MRFLLVILCLVPYHAAAIEAYTFAGLANFDREGGTLIKSSQLSTGTVGMDVHPWDSAQWRFGPSYTSMSSPRHWQLEELNFNASYQWSGTSWHSRVQLTAIAFSQGRHETSGRLLDKTYQYRAKLLSQGLSLGYAAYYSLPKQFRVGAKVGWGLRTIQSVGGEYAMADHSIGAERHQPVFILSRSVEIGLTRTL